VALCIAVAMFPIIQWLQGVWSPGSRDAVAYISMLVVMLTLAIGIGLAWWRMEPSRLTRLNYRRSPEIYGRHRDDIGPGGVTVISPDGSQTFTPWSAIASIRETSQAFRAAGWERRG
jgi:hypothetical protein